MVRRKRRFYDLQSAHFASIDLAVEELLSTHEAARRAGVGPTAIKRWADEGLLTCVRTAGGHRRFPRRELEAFLRRREVRPESISLDEADRWLNALLEAENAHAVASLLLRERSQRGAWCEVADFLGAVLARIGERWMAGTLCVFDEHVASERLHRALAAITDALPVSPNGPRCLLACAGYDLHTLGLSLADLSAREAGYATSWAGKSLPAEELARAIAENAYEVVALSASSYSTETCELAAWLDTIGEACRKEGSLLVLGGSGGWPNEAYGARRMQRFVDFAALLRELADRGERA